MVMNILLLEDILPYIEERYPLRESLLDDIFPVKPIYVSYMKSYNKGM